MSTGTEQTTERKIKRLMREIKEIDEFFYGSNQDKDRHSYAAMLERKRDDAVRSAVLQLHTALEDLLTEELFAEILGTPHLKYKPKLRSVKGKALARMLKGGGSLGFEMKLNFAVVADLLDKKTRDQLSELNTLRNKCSHNWLLNVPLRRAKKGGPAPRLLTFRGRDVHKVEVLKDICREYGNIYYRMFSRRLYRDELLLSARKESRPQSPTVISQPAGTAQ
ncbi:MAG: hypothetical protein AB1508_16735 [Pseudomonadota bacterium]